MNTIEDLRSTLFETLKGLKNETLDLERAKAISDLSQTIINTGKLEVEFMRQTGQRGTGFVPLAEPEEITKTTPTGTLTRTPGSVVHKLR